ncbi:hypothetical protein SAMN05444157_1203 [Frankineae bacterium MT45]|nr:hypothetical protein SAMN05444157_1203 [Frankineae bacterium MT45]
MSAHGRRRAAIAVGAALLALTTMTACQTKVGAAATVSGDRIESTDVSRYVGSASPSPAAAGAAAPPSVSDRRVLVLNTLVGQKLYDDALKANGGPATAAELSAARQQALSGETESDVTAKVVAAGYDASFEPVYLDMLSTEVAFVTRQKITTQSELDAALNKLKIPVEVSGRYGSWSEATHTVVSYVQPDFLRPTPSPTPAPQAAG